MSNHDCGTWQVWDCGDLVATFTDQVRAEACRADLLDEESHDWPHLADLASRCITVVHVPTASTVPVGRPG